MFNRKKNNTVVEQSMAVDTGGGSATMRFLPQIVLTVASVVLFIAKFGFIALNPTEADWLMSIGMDVKTEWISWGFYRQTPFHFPVIGTMEGYFYPTVTGVGQTGAIPLLAIPFKILSPILPKTFNYFGYWFLTCMILQSIFGIKLLKSLGISNKISLILGGSFFLLAPVLTHRLGHINLVCHFLILASFWNYFDTKISVNQKIKYSFIIVLLAAAIHQYMTVMVWGLSTALSLTLWLRKEINLKKWIFVELLKLLSIFSIFYLAGNFLIPFEANQLVGYGKYLSNLNAFFNPHEFSKLFSALPNLDGHYEGFAYLGTGILSILGIVMVSFFFKKTNILGGSKISWIFGLFVFLFWVYAWSNQIYWGATKLAHIKDNNIEFVGNMFRGSGRFVWVMYYFLMSIILAKFFLLHWSNALKNLVAMLFLGLQTYEMMPLYTYNKVQTRIERPIDLDKWSRMTQEADRLITYPFGSWSYGNAFDFFSLAEVALRNGQPISTGYLSRPDAKKVFSYQNKLTAALENGDLSLEPRSIFVVSATDTASVSKFEELSKRGLLRSFRFGGYPVFVPPVLTKTISLLEKEK